MSRMQARAATTLLAAPGLLWSALLFAGGIRAAADPLMRPPKLPRRRPPVWGLPTVGAATGAAVALAGGVLARGAAPGPARVAAAAGMVAAGAPGVLAPAFDIARRTTTAAPATTPGTIVVLGCALRGMRPSILLEARLRRAAGIARAVEARGGPAPDIIVTGGRGEDEDTTEAAAMAGWLRDSGLLPEASRILREDAAVNTVGNLELSAPLVVKRPVVAVTSDFHVFRVREEARALGLRWTVAGAPTPARFWATSLLREYLATLIRHPGAVAATAAGLCTPAMIALRG